MVAQLRDPVAKHLWLPKLDIYYLFEFKTFKAASELSFLRYTELLCIISLYILYLNVS